jgi:hypothetical protein
MGLEKSNITADELIRRIYEGDRDSRMAAERILLDGRPERTDALIAVLARENKKKVVRFGWFAAGFTILFIAVIGAITGLLSGDFNIGGFGYPMWMGAAAVAAYYAPTKLQKDSARALAASSDLRAVPLLIEALDKQDGATRAEVTRALIRLLPQLRADHGNLLTEPQLKILRDQTVKAENKEFSVASLKAVRQIGDEVFLDLVKSWSDGKGAAKKSELLKNEARDCLPFLEENIQRSKSGKILLRPASASDAADSLLRPVTASVEADSSMLLRAVREDEELPPIPALPSQTETESVESVQVRPNG